ncbi:MAG: 50S ribosomal protein L25 [Syntrophales bacterium]
MDPIVLVADKRVIIGKKVKALRREGITPGNIFGHSTASVAIQADTAAMEKVLATAGTTQMIMVKGPSFKKSRRVLTKGVQRNPVTGKLVHVDFHQIGLKDTVKVMVPLVFVGDSPVTRRNDLLLLENLHSVDVECLPGNIPEKLEVDISSLEEAGDSILVSDLVPTEGVSVLTSPEEALIRVSVAKVVREVVEEGEVAAEAVPAE